MHWWIWGDVSEQCKQVRRWGPCKFFFHIYVRHSTLHLIQSTKMQASFTSPSILYEFIILFMIWNCLDGCRPAASRLVFFFRCGISKNVVLAGMRQLLRNYGSFPAYLMLVVIFWQVTESDAVDVVESVLKDLRVTSTTVAFALTALLKLSSRFPDCAE